MNTSVCDARDGRSPTRHRSISEGNVIGVALRITRLFVRREGHYAATAFRETSGKCVGGDLRVSSDRHLRARVWSGCRRSLGTNVLWPFVNGFFGLSNEKHHHTERRVLAAMGDSEFDYSSDEFEGEGRMGGGKVRREEGKVSCHVPTSISSPFAFAVKSNEETEVKRGRSHLTPSLHTLHIHTGGCEPAARRGSRARF